MGYSRFVGPYFIKFSLSGHILDVRSWNRRC